MNHQNLGVGTQEHSRTVRNNKHTQEGYSYGNALEFCTSMQNEGIDVY